MRILIILCGIMACLPVLAMDTAIGIETTLKPEKAALIVTIVYEVLARIIPTVKDYTIVGRFIKWVNRVSELLNVRK